MNEMAHLPYYELEEGWRKVGRTPALLCSDNPEVPLPERSVKFMCEGTLE